MAPKRKTSFPISIGNCDITVEANNFTCNSDSNATVISITRSGKIKVSVKSDVSENHRHDSEDFRSEDKDHKFVLVSPKDVDGASKSYLQEVLQMYMTELPAMNYAANTGKKSKFLEKCVTNGKYRTLLLTSSFVENSRKVMAAITYQIIPADTEYAEIPLAAVSAIYQRKGFGHLLFLELWKRLESVGIRSILCWGDEESEGFWIKQGFIPIAQVDSKGKARKLPVKADIRKSLCFPGGSTLMVFHTRNELLANATNSMKCLSSHPNSLPSAIAENEKSEFSGGLPVDLNFSNQSSHRTENTDKSQPEVLLKDGSSRDYNKPNGFDRHNLKHCCSDIVPSSGENDDRQVTAAESSRNTNVKYCSQSTNSAKRVWEATLSSLKSKRVKGVSQLVNCQSDSSWGFISEAGRANPCVVEGHHVDPLIRKESEKFTRDNLHLEASINKELQSTKRSFQIMLMNIADDAKRTQLTRVIEDLGGTVSYDGSTTTHVVTGKVRKTLNFCTALCSGAWVVSSSWLKESFREGRFVDELPHILDDKDYLLKYKSDLKSAIFRAKASPHALFKGYNVCIAAHLQTPVKTLSAIVISAGGNVIRGLENVIEASTTIFVTCEEDTEEAMMAAKKGILTFSSEWFMNCVMRQELDLEAAQFAESL